MTVAPSLMYALQADQADRDRVAKLGQFILDPRVPGRTPLDEYGNPVKPGVAAVLDESAPIVQELVASGRLRRHVDQAEPFEGELFGRMLVATSFPGIGYVPIGSIIKITPQVSRGFLSFARNGSVELIDASEIGPTTTVVVPPPPVQSADLVKHHRKEVEARVLKELISARVQEILAEEKRAEEVQIAHAFRETKLELIRHKATRAQRLAAEADDLARKARAAQERAERAADISAIDVAPLETPPPRKTNDLSPEQIAERRADFQSGIAGALESQKKRERDAVPEPKVAPIVFAAPDKPLTDAERAENRAAFAELAKLAESAT